MDDDKLAALVYHHAIKQMMLKDVVAPVIPTAPTGCQRRVLSVGHSLFSDFRRLSSASLAAFNLVKAFAFFSYTDFGLKLGDARL